MRVKIWCIVFLLHVTYVFGQNLKSNTTGYFIYTPPSPLNIKPIKVFYRIPDGDIKTMRILMSFHGANRNAGDYRDYWINMANDNGFMVFAPEFSDANFPTADKYQTANIFVDGDNPSFDSFNPVNEWTISVIDPLFEYVKKDITGTQKKYNAWAHSGGAQFLHHFVEYLPNSKMDIAVCSNSGWYTVPELSIKFPYGIKDGQLSNITLTDAFSKKLIIHLGLNDIDPNSTDLRHTPILDNQQGTIRLNRGRYFFNTSQREAQNMNITYNWKKYEVAGIGHDAELMAKDALKFVLQSSSDVVTGINESSEDKQLKLYPNPATSAIYFDNSQVKLKQAKLFNNIGTLVSIFNFNDFRLRQDIDISNLPSGVYFLDFKMQRFIVLKN